MTKLRLTAMPEGYGLVLPHEVVKRLEAEEGTELAVLDLPQGVLICRGSAETVSQIEISADVMERRKDALRRLAE